MAKVFHKFLLYLLSKRNPIKFARAIGVKVGKDCRFIRTSSSTFGSEPFLIEIGDHVTIARDVKLITHDGGVWVFRKEFPNIEVFGRIRIGNNVFVGIGSIILPGTEVEDDVVIGAGSIVTGRLERGFVYAGVPARKISVIDDYRRKIMPKATMSKSMTPKKKREHINSFLSGG